MDAGETDVYTQNKVSRAGRQTKKDGRGEGGDTGKEVTSWRELVVGFVAGSVNSGMLVRYCGRGSRGLAALGGLCGGCAGRWGEEAGSFF